MRGILVSAILLGTFFIAALMLWKRRTRNIDQIPAQLDSYWDFLKERRKFIRFNKTLPVKCIVPERKGDIYHVFSKDVSGEGICIQVPEMLPEGSILELHISIPTGREIKVRGQVAWVGEPLKDASGERLYNTGIKLAKLGSHNRLCLKDYLETLSVDSKV